ncbi:MAG: hypothetical protein PHV30_08450 [Candidatus Margulisbacteria bacterium]|nr:hypothetical protein [Candidatus Margulisiibacteriota bacterium]
MEQCELIEKCGFFKKYQATKDLACKGFILQYCTGPKKQDCKRMQYRKEHGAPPPDEMMPSGQMLKV